MTKRCIRVATAAALICAMAIPFSGCANPREVSFMVGEVGGESNDNLGAQTPSRRFSWNDIVFPRIEIRGLVATLFSDGRYEVSGVVVNTDGGGIQEPHEVDFYIKFFNAPNGQGLVWGSPTWNYRVKERSARTIDQRGHAGAIESGFRQLNHAICYARKLD